MGIATAPHWSGTYTLLNPDPVLSNKDPYDAADPHHCEDPFLWKSDRGWHLLTHNQQGPQGESSYGYSLDGVNWKLSPTTPYGCGIEFADGTSGSVPGCGNRPQIFFKDGKPYMLINGANSGAGAKHPFTLFRHLKQ